MVLSAPNMNDGLLRLFSLPERPLDGVDVSPDQRRRLAARRIGVGVLMIGAIAYALTAQGCLLAAAAGAGAGAGYIAGQEASDGD